jgi:hypothetical protein
MRHYRIVFCFFVESRKVKVKVKKMANCFLSVFLVRFSQFMIRFELNGESWFLNGANGFNRGKGKLIAYSYDLVKTAFLVPADLRVAVGEDLGA